MIHDSIANMLTIIRNASLVKHKYVRINFNKTNCAILKILFFEKYIENYEIEKTSSFSQFKHIKIVLRYNGWWIKKPFFSTFRRISKLSKRIFYSIDYFKKFSNFLKYNDGIAILSTSSGIISHFRAKQINKGGEVLCYIS
jgi:small subunit ribosomal protein S8